MQISHLFLPVLARHLAHANAAWKFPEAEPGVLGGGRQHPMASVLGGDDDVDIITGSQFNGLSTYANLPYVNCMSSPEGEEGERYDIAILGAPFDTVSRNHSPSPLELTRRNSLRQKGCDGQARSPLRSLGDQSREPEEERGFLLERVHGRESSQIVGQGRGLRRRAPELAGQERRHGPSEQGSQGDGECQVVSGRKAANEKHSTTPRIITLGGDHTTTLSALRSTRKRWGKVSVIHFDSHIDTWDPAVLGGGISDYAGLNHGTFLHIAHEEGLIHNTSSIHAGIRAPLYRRKGDMRNDRRCGFAVITARALDRAGGASGVVSQIRERVLGGENSRVYISVDIDVLDPAFAPATGTPEPGGWSTRELLTILDGLGGLDIVGADVVEVAPVYDTRGETTTLAAAEVVFSLIELMVGKKPVKSIAGGL